MRTCHYLSLSLYEHALYGVVLYHLALYEIEVQNYEVFPSKLFGIAKKKEVHLKASGIKVETPAGSGPCKAPGAGGANFENISCQH